MPTKSILIVEDDLNFREVIELVLMEETKYKIFVASDGEAALRLLQTAAPDLFLLDYWLPGMNGVALIGHIRGNDKHKHTPIVLMSASHSWPPEDSRDVRYLAKPFDLDIFLRTVEEAISAI